MVFIRAGITFEEARNEFLERENKIIKEIENEQKKRKSKKESLIYF